MEVERHLTRFLPTSTLVSISPFAGGHINDSFRIDVVMDGSPGCFLLQRLNPSVFPHPERVMENIQRVTRHLEGKLSLEGAADSRRRVLSLVPTPDGDPWIRDDTGALVRLYLFIEGSRVKESVTSPVDARTAGRAYGTFLARLADLPSPPLHETIARFHDTPFRFEQLEDSARADTEGRRGAVQEELAFLENRRPGCGILQGLLERGELPRRVVHNDAKMSNVLLDETTGEALCVVDLDTVMTGTSLHDVGDMIRSMTSTAEEDEPDPSRVTLDTGLFAALIQGYLEGARSVLVAAEIENIVESGRILCLEQAARFLADHLAGDRYYRITRPGQNLDRARVQMALVEQIEGRKSELVGIVRSATG